MSRRRPKIHVLKCWPDFFQAMLDGTKTFDARRNDRDFQVGDTLKQVEWTPADSIHSALGEYSGRVLWFKVTYVLPGSDSNTKTGIGEGFCVMGIKRIYANRKTIAQRKN